MAVAIGTAGLQGAWATDVRIRLRPGRADSGVKLYVTDRTREGAREFMANTGFMRYPVLFAGLADVIARSPSRRVLIAPLSVGLEAVSLAIACLRAAPDRLPRIEGFDISAKASELARTTTWPRLFFPPDLSQFDGMLSETEDGYVEATKIVRDMIRILPAADILAFAPKGRHDLVLCLNLMMHLPADARAALVDKLADCVVPGGVLALNNNQEWPGELESHFAALTALGWTSLEAEFVPGATPEGSAGPAPHYAVTDANAMILRKPVT